MLKVKEDLISTKIYEKLDISPTADTNRNYNIILDEINQAKNKYMMSKLVKFNKYKHNYMDNSRFASLNTTQR